MPDPLSILRLTALVAFIGLVAVGLWLLDVAWWVVPPVMAVALLIAWTIEWLAWRGAAAAVVPESALEPPAPAMPVEAPARAPAKAIVPPEPSPQPKPEPQPGVSQAEPPQRPPRPEPPPPPPERPAPPPQPKPDPEPAPEPQGPPEPVAAPPAEDMQPRQRRPRRMRLLSSPAPRPRPQPEPAPPPAAESGPVVPFRPRVEPRSWNLWDLERIAREETRDHPERRDELAYLFLNLRQFADADGTLPLEFDGLVRESFGGRLESPRGA